MLGDSHRDNSRERVSDGFIFESAYHEAAGCVIVCSRRGEQGRTLGKRGLHRSTTPSHNLNVIQGSATSIGLVTNTTLAEKYRAAERYNNFVP